MRKEKVGKRRRKDGEGGKKVGRRKGTIREESTRPEAQGVARKVSPKPGIRGVENKTYEDPKHGYQTRG